MRLLAIACCGASVLLAACDQQAPVEREDGSATEAEGEVLGGSISDAMLPLDSVQSQSPPLKRAAGNDGADIAGDAAGSESGGDSATGPDIASSPQDAGATTPTAPPLQPAESAEPAEPVG